MNRHIEHNAPAGDCRLLVGTSGYAYTEWSDAGFYPPDTRSGWMLPFYARNFCAVELNYTWYQMPRPETIERQRQQVPPGFQFAAKLTRTLTHEIEPGAWPGLAADYRNGVAPLVQAGQMTAVLIQFPPYFARSIPNRRHLAALLDALAGLPVAVEFRHRSWASDRVFDELERRRVSLVAVDGPDLPGVFPALDVVTSPDLFYVRFHGRNTRGWRSGNMQRQFDYNYSDDELQQWVVEKIEPMCARARQGILFFNNHVRAQAAANARQMLRLLKMRGLAAG